MKPNFKCIRCGKKEYKMPCMAKKQKYCSTRCAQRAKWEERGYFYED